jgi:APA family basic amino acid/polyamine antiporter
MTVAGESTRAALAAQKGSRLGLVRGLSLLDSVLLLVGGIVGSGIFLAVKGAAQPLRHPAAFLGIWVLGGAISLLACFAFAELGAMYPESGGQYVYLREAYGEFWAFLFGWMVFSVNFTGTIAALGVGFAEYSEAIFPYGAARTLFAVSGWTLTRSQLVALAVIALLTWANVVGLRRAAVLQNIATWMKFAAIGVFVLLGFAFGRGSSAHFTTAAPAAAPVGTLFAVALALNAVFWAYDGWNYIACTAGEVRDPQRNIPRALVIGIGLVAMIYVGLNLVYVYALPLSGIAQEETVAQVAAVALFSPAAGRWISVLIAVSCFGAMSACILSGARVVYAMGCDGAFFRGMAYVHPRWRTPTVALIAQGIWSGVLALSGRYDQLYTYVMLMGVLAYMGTVAGLFVLRCKRPDLPRPYRCTGYPWAPAIYLVAAAVWAAIVAWQRPKEAIVGTVVMLVGVPAYVLFRRTSAHASK